MNEAISSVKTFLMKKDATGDTYTKYLDIKDFPDVGGAPEMLETTTLSDTMQTYIPGIRKVDALEFTANYTEANYTKVKADEEKSCNFAIWMGGTDAADGTVTPTGDKGKFSFTGMPSVYVKGAGTNAVVDMGISIAVQSAIVKEE